MKTTPSTALPRHSAVTVVCLGLMLLPGLVACGAGKAESDKTTTPAIPVEVSTVGRGEMLGVYSGTAPIEADGEAVVVAKVGGELRELLVEEGTVVRKGQVLARLDGDRLRLEVSQARAQLAKLERDYQRNVELQKRGLVAASAFENLRYEVEAAKASYDLAALQLSYAEIRAPLAGVVAERYVKAGNTLAPNEKVVRIADLTPLVAYVHVPEREMRKLQVGQVAAARVDAAGGEFRSVIRRISPVVDSATGTFKVMLELVDPGHQLRPGMFARIDIVHERRTDVVRVPRAAILEDDGTPRVFVVQQGKARSREVTPGLTNGPLVEIGTGLAGGEQLVVVGQGTLKDGSPVRIVGTSPTAASPTRPAR